MFGSIAAGIRMKFFVGIENCRWQGGSVLYIYEDKLEYSALDTGGKCRWKGRYSDKSLTSGPRLIRNSQAEESLRTIISPIILYGSFNCVTKAGWTARKNNARNSME